MLCYVMLCYVMLCYVMLCYVMLCYLIWFDLIWFDLIWFDFRVTCIYKFHFQDAEFANSGYDFLCTVLYFSTAFIR